MIDINDPVLAARLLAAIDQRVVQVLAARLPKVAYGVVDSVDVANLRCAVFVSGAAVSTPGFTYSRHLTPAVGDLVRVVIASGGDKYVDAQLTGTGPPRYVPLSTSILAVNNTSTADEAVQALAEFTVLPNTGVVAVTGVLSVMNSDTANSEIAVHHWTGGLAGEAWSPGVANCYATSGFTCATGGTNNCQIQWSSDWVSGTQSRVLWITGYWTTE